jgi:thiamine-phosphate pyrophosphorylase
MKSLAECHLYAFVDTAYLYDRSPRELARQLCDGGADIIQLRAKQYPLDRVRGLAEAMLPVTRRAGVPLVINDYFLLAQEIGADLCHLGQEDFFGARHTHVSQLSMTGRRVGLGLSTHSQAQAERALAAGPDYLGVGPVYSTATKPEAQPIAREYLQWAVKHVRLPWFAIGGINLDTLDEVLAAGVRRVCVVSAILNADDVAGVCRKFKDRLTTVR